MKNISVNLQEIIKSGVNIILPPRCPLSGDIVDAQGMISPEGWGGLEFITDPLCNHCGIPLDYDVGEVGKCMSCLDNPPEFNSARAAFRYNDISRNLILGFKHGDKTHIVRSFAPWLAQAGKGMLANADYLLPVPLHHLRLVSRRYNQAALIAESLSKHVGIAHLPMAIKRVRSTPSQGHLSTKDRLENVSKAFDVPIKYRGRLKGKSIILIDDVYTTGATAHECTKILRKYGAAQVHILTLARVIHD